MKMNKSYIPLTALVLAALTVGCDKIFPKNRFSTKNDSKLVVSERVVRVDYEGDSIPTINFSDVNPSIPFGRATSEFGVECYDRFGRVVNAVDSSSSIPIIKDITYTCRAANENALQAERIVSVGGLFRVNIDDDGNETQHPYTGFNFDNEGGRLYFTLPEGMYRVDLTVGRFVPKKKDKTEVVKKKFKVRLFSF